MQEAYYSRKGLGGSGSINYLTYLRGSRLDFDEWEQLGCKGWSYKDVLPYFIYCEKNTNPGYVKSGECVYRPDVHQLVFAWFVCADLLYWLICCVGYHGNSGPMLVSDLEKTPLVDVFLEAGEQIGCPTLDVNGQEQLGTYEVQFMTFCDYCMIFIIENESW